MAIYHMSAQVIGRSSGRSATASSAYRAGEKILDERTGEIHDYTRKSGVDYSVILSPDNVGEWAQDRAELWNKVEQTEKRKDAQLAREINVAIPHELTSDQGRELVTDYAQKNFVSQGMIADVCIHGEGTENPHAHIMLTTREAELDGFGKKNRDWNDKAKLEDWRAEWAHECNKSLEKAGHNIVIDHRTLAEQGIDREPTIHKGVIATEIERKGGISDRGEINRDIEQKNDDLERLQGSLRELTAELELIAREQKQEPQKAEQREQQKSLSHYLQKEPEQAPESGKRPDLSKYIGKQENTAGERVYNKENTEKALSYIQNHWNYKEVKGVYEQIKADAQPKTLQGELEKNAEYSKAVKAYEYQLSSYNNCTERLNNLRKDAENLGMMDSIKYKMGQHDLNKIIPEYEKEQQAHLKKGKEVTAHTNELKGTLTKELEPEIAKHNDRAEKAGETLRAIEPSFQARQDKARAIMREKSRGKEPERSTSEEIRQRKEKTKNRDRGRSR